MTEPTNTPAADDPQGETAECHGRSFRVNPEITGWDITDFLGGLREAAEDPESAGLDGMITVRNFAMEYVHPEERGAFRIYAKKLAREQGDDKTIADILRFVGLKIEADAERPTEQPSDSSDGLNITAPSAESNSDGKDSYASGLALVRERADLAEFRDNAARAS